MAIYQFLIAVRSNQGGGGQSFVLTNADGETTSHIQGMFNRTIRYLTEGLKPVFVFDGKPPVFKSGELLKRREKREKAQAALQQATESGDVEEQDKQSKRLVRAGQKENEDCQKLLKLMGVPVVLAPCEAEAQAAALAKAGTVYATGTEDMDALTFRTPVLVRKMTFANASKAMVQTMNYDKALEGLGLAADQFVDLCIMLGCDYCDTIKGVGPKTALKLIREHGSIEKILDNIDGKKYVVPESWMPPTKKMLDEDDNGSRGEENVLNEVPPTDANEEEFIPAYVQARKLFNHHEVLENVELKWNPCQKEELTKFLVDSCGFSPDRVASSIEKLEAAYKANKAPQSRLDAFFKVIPSAKSVSSKRKTEPKKKELTGRKKRR